MFARAPSDPADASAPGSGAGGRSWVNAVSAALGTFALLLLSRPYGGITGDAIIYTGRAMADRDPEGLGRDLMFAHDGQSGWSLFTPINRALVGALGPDVASFLLVHLGLLLWFVTAFAFARELVRGRMLWAALAFAALLSSTYGGHGGFRVAEPLAIPRPFAEAAVLGSLAAALAGRNVLSAALIGLAAILHPIMALAGAGVWLVLATVRDRRWALLPAAGLALMFGAALAELPFARRILTPVDPEWARSISAYANLFPTRWSVATWIEAGIRAATVALAAASLGPGRERAVLLAILGVGAGGLALAVVGGDWLGLLLVIQAQTWRVLWLVSAAALLTFPVAAVGLWRWGEAGRAGLALLCLAWILAERAPFGAGLCAAGALLLGAFDRLRPDAVGRLVSLGAVATLGAVAVGSWLSATVFAAGLLRGAPAEASYLGGLWRVGVATLPIGALVLLLALRPGLRIGLPIKVATAAALVLVAIALRDDRSALTRRLDTWQPDPALATLLPATEGDILWIRAGALPAWVLAGRRNWVSAFQGANLLFSRDEAANWEDRIGRLLAAGLGDESDRAPLTAADERRDLRPDAARLGRFCAAPDAPVAMVAPADGSVAIPPGFPLRPYRLPVPDYAPVAREDGTVWERRDDLLVMACRRTDRGR